MGIRTAVLLAVRLGVRLGVRLLVRLLVPIEPGRRLLVPVEPGRRLLIPIEPGRRRLVMLDRPWLRKLAVRCPPIFEWALWDRPMPTPTPTRILPPCNRIEPKILGIMLTRRAG